MLVIDAVVACLGIVGAIVVGGAVVVVAIAVVACDAVVTNLLVGVVVVVLPLTSGVSTIGKTCNVVVLIARHSLTVIVTCATLLVIDAVVACLGVVGAIVVGSTVVVVTIIVVASHSRIVVAVVTIGIVACPLAVSIITLFEVLDVVVLIARYSLSVVVTNASQLSYDGPHRLIVGEGEIITIVTACAVHHVDIASIGARDASIGVALFVIDSEEGTVFPFGYTDVQL